MIGQKELIENITNLIESEKFPRFSILVGAKGSGKKLLADILPTLFKGIDYIYILPDIKVDSVRDMIEQAYKTVTRTFFIIPDADNMSLAAKNALLKVTEEPPNNAYFIMTLQDEMQTLATIRSRGTIFHMDNYSPSEILEYAKTVRAELSMDETELIIDLCEVPGDVNILLNQSIIEFYDYVKLTVDNIATVSGANSFKIADKVALKDSDESKYDLQLFWRAFIKECLARAKDEAIYQYAKGVQITSKYMQELRITGLNRQMCFDAWLLDIRKEWMQWI